MKRDATRCEPETEIEEQWLEHTDVGFAWDDIDFDEMELMRKRIRSGQGAKAEAAKIRLQEIKQMLASRPKIQSPDGLVFEVSDEGATDANFEIGK